MTVTMQDIMVVFESVPGLPFVTTNKAHVIAKALNDRAAQKVDCCEPTKEEKALLAAGDYTPEELWGGSRPTCPKCIGEKVAAVGLPEPVAYRVHNGKFGQSSLFAINPVAYREQGYDVQDLIDRDAVEPLVAAKDAHIDLLRRELSSCEVCRKENYEAAYLLRDERDTLRTQNAELVGLLRNLDDAWNDPAGRSRFGEYMRQVEPALSAYEGREGE